MAVFRLTVAAVLLLGWSLAADEPPADLASAEKLLQAAKVPTDGPALVQFFQSRTLTAAERDTLTQSVRKLGSDDFDAREQASADVARAGIAALSLLRSAARDPDPEVVRRAEIALAVIEKDYDTARFLAAARVLLDRKPPGAVEALLAYLPTVHDDEMLFDGAVQLLTDSSRDNPNPLIVADLKSPDAARRRLAGRILAAGKPEQREAVRVLLDDADPVVRFQVATTFLRNRDRAVMPKLLALLSDGPTEQAFRVEDLLCQLLLDGETPGQTLGNADAATRKACREFWEDWWKRNGATADLARLNDAEPLRGLTLVVEVDNNGGFNGTSGRIWECGPDGKQRWEMTTVGGPVDVQVLPGGRFLVAEYYTRKVSERDRTGKLLWEYGGLTNNPVSCQRLANGNTLIATMQDIVEVTPDKKKVGNYPRPPGTVYHARKGKNGHTFYLANGQIYELDPAGKQVRATNVGNTSGWGGFDVLPNGHFLVASYVANNRVAEFDAAGKVVWEAPTPSPTRVQRLRNGNTLVAGGNQAFVIEYDRAKKEVWKVATRGRPFSVLRY